MKDAIQARGVYFLSLAALHQGATAAAIPHSYQLFIVSHSAKLALLVSSVMSTDVNYCL